jgi:hypothetical protein
MPAVMVITLGNAMGVSERATASLAEKVADGRPWNVTIAKPGIQTRIGLVSGRLGHDGQPSRVDTKVVANRGRTLPETVRAFSRTLRHTHRPTERI